MTFSLNEIAAFEALEKSIGKLDMDVMDVSEAHAEIYAKHARDFASNALYYFSAYQLATSIDLKEKQEIILNERRRVEREKAQAQAIEKRESHVLSLLSGLAPKANKVRESTVHVGTDDKAFHIQIWSGTSHVLYMEYDRETYMLDGQLLGVEFDQEDWSALSGNSTPVLQSPAYAKVVEYLSAQGASA